MRYSIVFLRIYLLVFLELSLTQCLGHKNKDGRYTLQDMGMSLELSVLTFNILSTTDLKSISEGYPLWVQRKDQVFAILNDQNPDLAAIQEASPSQFDQFQSFFSANYTFIHYRAFTSDAFVMFKTSRFELIEKGHWILEEGLKNLQIQRIAVWVKLRDLASNRELMFVGTHLDAKKIKEKQAELLKEHIRKQQLSGAPLFIAGDFNFDQEDPVYPTMLSDGWKDSYLGDLVHQTPTYPVKNPHRRIDHVFYFGSQVEPLRWNTLENKDGKIMSDHKPVFVRFVIHQTARKD